MSANIPKGGRERENEREREKKRHVRVERREDYT